LIPDKIGGKPMNSGFGTFIVVYYIERAGNGGIVTIPRTRRLI
jgi:hypothetical protein